MKIMELAKPDIWKIIRGFNRGSIQLKNGEYSCSPERDILRNILVNGLVQRKYTCCCICKDVLKNGAGNKACRNRHISKHYRKGDLVSPRIIAQLVDNFNLLHRRC